MAERLVDATRSRMRESLRMSFWGTVREMVGQGTDDGKGSRMPSAMMTGTHPRATDSTSRGLHGAHPRGQRQKTERAISDWYPA